MGIYRWLLLAALAGLVAVVLLSAARSRRHRQLIGRQPTPIAEVTGGSPPGLAFLVGKAAPGPDGPLAAPLSGEPCVWYDVTVLKSVRVRFNRFVWREVWRGGPGGPFTVTDGTGAVLVSPDLPRHSIVEASPDEMHEQTLDRDTDHRSAPDDPWIVIVIGMLESGGQAALATHLRRGGGGIRCVERVMRTGTRIGVVGRARTTGAGVVLERAWDRTGGAAPVPLKRLRAMSGQDRGVSVGFVVLVVVIAAGWACAALSG